MHGQWASILLHNCMLSKYRPRPALWRRPCSDSWHVYFLRRVYCAESTLDREIEIIQDLQNQVLECAESIATICERSAELDWYASIIG